MFIYRKSYFSGFQNHMLLSLLYLNNETCLEKMSFGLIAVVNGNSHQEGRQSCVSLIDSIGLRPYATL